jgi:peptidoglycan/xylan/chitin deacetylase (PgdA/CDA1 family)
MLSTLPLFRLDRFLTLYGAAPYLKRSKLREPFLPILMYHSISDDPESGVHGYYRVTTSPARFREQMQWLKEHGYKAVSLAEGLDRLKSKPANSVKSDRDRIVVLTFDDGYQDFLTHAWPVLAEFRMTATVYLPTAFIGNQPKIFKERMCLTWPQVRELYGMGISFGSHTVSHAQLHELNWTDIQKELSDSRKCLEDQLGHHIHDFAYPYAYPSSDHVFCDRLDAALQNCGYHYGVTTMIGTVVQGDNRMRLHRLPVNDCDDISFFAVKMDGGYDWLETGQRIVKSLKYF